MPRDEQWLAATIIKAETLEEAKLAVSVFLAARAKLPLRVPEAVGPALLRLVPGECAKVST
jgi:hypothetical protein